MKTAIVKLAGLLLGVLPLGALCAEGVAVPSARDFARLPTYEQLELSPDGRYLAVTVHLRGQISLGVLDIENMKPVSGLTFTRGDSIAGVHWATSRRLLVEMATEYGPLDSPMRTGEIFAMDVDGKNREMLYGYRSRVVSEGTHLVGGRVSQHRFAVIEDTLPDQDFSLVSLHDQAGSYSGLYRMDVVSGAVVPAARPPMRYPHQYFADRQGHPRLVMGEEDKSGALVNFYRDSNEEWKPVPIAGQRVQALQVAADGGLAWFDVEETSGRECLVGWNTRAPELPAQPLHCEDRPILGQVFYTASRQPYAVEIGDQGTLALIEQKSAESIVLASLRAQFAPQEVRPISASADHGKLLYRVSSDRNSGELYLYDFAKKKAAYVDAFQAWLDPEQMAEQKRFTYKARDGLLIHALLTIPHGKVAKNLPLVVHPHGGPIGIHDRWGFDSDAQFLASRGYAVLQVNYRGSSGQGEAFEKAGYREWGGKMIDDITDGVKQVIADGTVDKTRICIFGASYGGYASLMSAVREPDLYRCAVGYAGVYDLPLLKAESDVSEQKIGRDFLNETMGTDPAFLKAQSPISRLDQLKAAVMIVHGEEDIRAPLSQAKSLRKALDSREIPYQWLVKSGEGHGFFNEDNRTELYEKLAAFLDQNIGHAQP
jgi:dienelactone hydrolase